MTRPRRIARITLSLETLASLLRLPDGCELLDIESSLARRAMGDVELLVASPEFDEVQPGYVPPYAWARLTQEPDGRMRIVSIRMGDDLVPVPVVPSAEPTGGELQRRFRAVELDQ